MTAAVDAGTGEHIAAVVEHDKIACLRVSEVDTEGLIQNRSGCSGSRTVMRPPAAVGEELRTVIDLA